MLSDYDVGPTIPTADLDTARAFYEETLGFTVDQEGPNEVVYRSGGCKFLLYRSEYAGTNQATYMSFTVPTDEAFDAEVETLKSKGITFDVFETPPGTTWNGGVLTMEGMRAVWFSDPDENILNVSVGYLG